MRSGALPLKLLVTLFFAIVHFTDGGKLDFYQDVEPQSQEDIMYKRIARYLESKNHESRDIRRARMSPILPWQYDEYLDYRRQKEKTLLEALLENPGLIDVLENQKMIPNYDNQQDYSRNGVELGVPFSSIESQQPRIYDDYNKINGGYGKDLSDNEKAFYPHVSGFQLPYNPVENENYRVEELNSERLLKLEEKLMEMNANRVNPLKDKFSSETSKTEPEFTFKFDQPKINERDTFGVRPNDPRYYEDDTRTTSLFEEKKTTPEREKVTESSVEMKDPFEAIEDQRRADNDYNNPENERNDKFSLMKVTMPEFHRRSEQDPLVVTSSRMTNNDIYFIAIVAGCSAACMFALVLIALTWCRLQRGAKAAADIEYPAYGVTGPNKDISPSGDQRLAHSAQMYHFQHQKQQIIAMESRTAASRDPGSVSEAESDEENEEGDYTVYECPGLASTGEMEVKNPMFHDDPTPATPPQIHKDEDHI